MKNHFFGKYYKFISDDGYTFALIVSRANEGDMLQLVTPSKGYFIDDTKSVIISGNIVHIDIHQDDISLKGDLELGELHPINNVMGPFSIFPMECKHDIYSMYHTVKGILLLNGKELLFTNALGYIEGDKGVNFPTKYIWYNSVTKDVTVTLAIATIPLLGFINFTGLLCFIRHGDKTYRICTYNNGKIIKKSEEEIIIRKGKYKLILSISHIGGHDLKAPIKGDMNRYIKENINVHTSYKLMYKDEEILSIDDPLSSLEYMY